MTVPDERAVYGVTLALLLVASALAGVVVSGSGGSGPGPSAPAAGGGADYEVTDGGTRYRVHPSELRQGCPGMDCIPSIDDPGFQSPEEATWLEPDDLVIGVEVDGEARAYPLRILAVHEIVNDRVGGRPVAVTYCPLCRSGLVFDRRVAGSTLEFGVSGKLLDANLVMYDRGTETYWSQLTGEAIVGPQVPRTLDLVPSSITRWGKWRENHPDTVVLSRNTGIYPAGTYSSNPYAGYADSSGVGFGVDSPDPRLPAKAIVYGVAVDNASTAYPADVVAERGVVNDAVGDVPVLVVEAPDGSVRVFVREVDGETLGFSTGEEGLVGPEGGRWSFEGEALSGPHEGTRLERLATHGVYWFAWSSFHPETGVYRANATG